MASTQVVVLDLHQDFEAYEFGDDIHHVRLALSWDCVRYLAENVAAHHKYAEQECFERVCKLFGMKDNKLTHLHSIPDDIDTAVVQNKVGEKHDQLNVILVRELRLELSTGENSKTQNYLNGYNQQAFEEVRNLVFCQ